MTQKTLNPIIRVNDELTFSLFNPISSLEKKKISFRKYWVLCLLKDDGKFNSSDVLNKPDLSI